MEDLFIKAATVIAVALATFSSFPGTAQQDPAPQGQNSPAPENPQASSGTAMNPAAANLKPVSGQLVNKLDAKSARQGDSVVVKTDQNLRTAAGTEIPKGSRLVGHVTNVQPRGDGRENSQIAIQFDHAELKDGQSLPIESVIQSVAPSTEPTMGSSSPAGAFGATSSIQGATNGPTSTAPVASPAPGEMTQNTTDNNRPDLADNTAVQSGGTAPNTGGSAPGPGLPTTVSPAEGSIVARNGNVAIRTTAIPGVLLANDIHGMPFTNASGMILGARCNVHLDGGTRFVLAVAMAQSTSGASR